MRATKDSGLDWLGEIPADWNVLPARALFRNPSEPSKSDDIHLTPSQKYGVLPQNEYMAISGSRVVLNLSGSEQMRHVMAGDFISHLRSFQGGLEYSPFEGKVSNAYTVLRPRRPLVAGYFKHLFKSTMYIQGLQTTTDQLRDGQSIRFKQLCLLALPNPPLEEQRRIADFLDRETAKIDTLIAKQEQLITTLDERRKAVIARYISQGVNRDSKLVQTGNPQVAAIPNHWSLKRLRHFAQIESGADYKDLETFEDGFPVYGSGGVFAQASEYMYNGESVLFGRKGTIDRPIYVNGPFWTVDTMYWTRFNQPVNVKFVYYWATTVPFGLFTTSTALPSMTSSDIKNFFVAMPPFSEQIDIVEHLDGAVVSIDHLTSAAQKTVETLKERRQALISAAVTGKLEVGV